MANNNVIKLYVGFGTTFDSDCVILPNVISCTITEEMNGEYELEMVHPYQDKYFPKTNNIILAKPNGIDDPQPFRVYKVSTPFNGKVTIYAHHISYDLNEIPIAPFTASSVAGVLNAIASHSYVTCPFTFETDETEAGEFAISVPTSARSILLGENSIINTYGGILKFDKFKITYRSERTEDYGNKIEYGYNMTDINVNDDISDNIGAILPYWKSSGEDGTLVVGSLIGSSNYAVPKDFSSDFEAQPTVQELTAYATAWRNEQAYKNSSRSINVSFADLMGTEEYKNSSITPIKIGEQITVRNDNVGINWQYFVKKIKYDVLKGKVLSIDIGNNYNGATTKKTLSDTIVSISKDVDTKTNATEVRQAAKVSSTTVESNGKVWFETYRDAVPKAVPYTSTSSGLSEIVTKQDLINLGLI